MARDAGPHGLHGTLHGPAYAQLAEGFALRFDGEDDYVEVPDAEVLRLPRAVSVSAWVSSPVVSEQNVVGKNGCSTLRQNYRLKLYRGVAELTLVECPEHGKPVSGGTLRRDSWHHVAGTYDGEHLRMYVDGQLRAETRDAFAVGTLEAPLYIGAAFYGGGLLGHFTGLIDDVRVYSRALSADEIAAGYELEKDWRISVRDRLLARVSPVDAVDTTPPTLWGATPPPGSQAVARPAIAARFDDEGGSGVDRASLRLHLDGREVTEQAAIDESGFTLTPSADLAPGAHLVEARVRDRAGNPGNVLRWRFGVGQPVPVVARFDGDVFRVHGEPFFPVGIYASNVSPTHHMPYLAQAAAAGINYKLIGEHRAAEVLDGLLEAGMMGLVHVYYASLALGQDDPQPLTGLVEEVRSHPANLGWWNEYVSVNQSDLAVATYDLVRSLDRAHPVIYMLTWAGRLSDAYFVYGYPILNPLLPDDSILSIDELTLGPAFEAAAGEGEGKHVWFASQAFDYRLDMNRGEIVTLEGGFRPSREEIRSMNYLALTMGVKGLLFYAAGGEIPDTRFTADIAIYPRQWTEVLKVASEVRHLAPALATGARTRTARLGTDNPAIRFTELVHDGAHTLIAVNVEPQMTLAEWRFDRPGRVSVLFEDRVSATSVDTFTDLFEPLEVHIYRWEAAP